MNAIGVAVKQPWGGEEEEEEEEEEDEGTGVQDGINSVLSSTTHCDGQNRLQVLSRHSYHCCQTNQEEGEEDVPREGLPEGCVQEVLHPLAHTTILQTHHPPPRHFLQG